MLVPKAGLIASPSPALASHTTAGDDRANKVKTADDSRMQVKLNWDQEKSDIRYTLICVNYA